MFDNDLDHDAFSAVVYHISSPTEAADAAVDLLLTGDDATQESALLGLATVYLAHHDDPAALESILEYFWGFNLRTPHLFCEALAFIEQQFDEENGVELPEHATTLYGYLELREVNHPALRHLGASLLDDVDGVTTLDGAANDRLLRYGAVLLHLHDTTLLLDALSRGGPVGELAFLRLLDLVEDPRLIEASAIAVGVIEKPLEAGGAQQLSPLVRALLRSSFPDAE